MDPPNTCFTFAVVGSYDTVLIDEHEFTWTFGYLDFETIETKTSAAVESFDIISDKNENPWDAESNSNAQLALEQESYKYAFEKITFKNLPNISFNFAAVGNDRTILIDEKGQAWAVENGNYAHLKPRIQIYENPHQVMVDGQPLQVMSPFQKTRVKSAKSDEY